MPVAHALDTKKASRWFHALSDETRLEVIERLLSGERCVCDLTDDLDAAQSRLSFHLKTLKDAGLVNDRRDGRWVYYTLNRETLDAIEAVLSAFQSGLKASRSGAKCCD